jgi:hypothetical protein
MSDGNSETMIKANTKLEAEADGETSIEAGKTINAVDQRIIKTQSEGDTKILKQMVRRRLQQT